MNIFEDTNPRLLSELLGEIQDGKSVLPDFQRDFVWEPRATQELVVSIAQLRSLESKHEILLAKVLNWPLLSNSAIKNAGLLPAPAHMTKPASASDGFLE
jgi:hypothetical protein